MCIGVPMRVLEAWPGGALAAGRGRCERIDTRLIGGQVAPGDWLLEFQGAARERLNTARAAEINATLDLVEAVMNGQGAEDDIGQREAAFELPSRMNPEQLAALAGQPKPRGEPT